MQTETERRVSEELSVNEEVPCQSKRCRIDPPHPARWIVLDSCGHTTHGCDVAREWWIVLNEDPQWAWTCSRCLTYTETLHIWPINP